MIIIIFRIKTLIVITVMIMISLKCILFLLFGSTQLKLFLRPRLVLTRQLVSITTIPMLFFLLLALLTSCFTDTAVINNHFNANFSRVGFNEYFDASLWKPAAKNDRNKKIFIFTDKLLFLFLPKSIYCNSSCMFFACFF